MGKRIPFRLQLPPSPVIFICTASFGEVPNPPKPRVIEFNLHEFLNGRNRDVVNVAYLCQCIIITRRRRTYDGLESMYLVDKMCTFSVEMVREGVGAGGPVKSHGVRGTHSPVETFWKARRRRACRRPCVAGSASKEEPLLVDT